MKAPDKKSGKSTTSTAAPPARAASFTIEAQAEGAAEKAPDEQGGESTSTAVPPAHATSFTSEAQAEGAVEKAPDKKQGESTSTAVPHVRMRPVRLRASWLASVPYKTFAYSDAEWQKIKNILAPLDIDADAMTIGDLWWAQACLLLVDRELQLSHAAAALVAEPRRPLREQLQGLAAEFFGLVEFYKQRAPGALTPRQEAAEIREALNKFARPLAAALSLDNSLTFSFSPHRETVSKALAPFIAHAQRFHDRLMAEGSQSSANARSAHREYWDWLSLLWQAITAGKTPRLRERGLNSFLLTCSGPVFPDKTSKSTINDFLRKTGKRT